MFIKLLLLSLHDFRCGEQFGSSPGFRSRQIGKFCTVLQLQPSNWRILLSRLGIWKVPKQSKHNSYIDFLSIQVLIHNSVVCLLEVARQNVAHVI